MHLVCGCCTRTAPSTSGVVRYQLTGRHFKGINDPDGNTRARAHGRDHELIREDPDGPIARSRFRQTVAWFINRRPGGRVALGIQYGHLQLTMSEAYGSRGRTDMLEILDLERARTLADTLAEAADRLDRGEHVSGPAAKRYRASAQEFTATYQGAYLSKRQ